MRELEKNVALRVEQVANSDHFAVSGRGILHLSVLIETMRREGYELSVGKPQVILREEAGVKQEPFETLSIMRTHEMECVRSRYVKEQLEKEVLAQTQDLPAPPPYQLLSKRPGWIVRMWRRVRKRGGSKTFC